MAKNEKNQVAARDSAKGMEIGYSREVSDYGPLPAPEDVAKYGEIIPDFGNRVMKMAEERQSSDIAFRDKVAEQDDARIKRGQVFVTLICLCGYGVAAYALWLGFPWACAVLGGIVSICVAAIATRNNGKNKDEA